MVKRYHASFPSLSYGFDSRYPLQGFQRQYDLGLCPAARWAAPRDIFEQKKICALLEGLAIFL